MGLKAWVVNRSTTPEISPAPGLAGTVRGKIREPSFPDACADFTSPPCGALCSSMHRAATPVDSARIARLPAVRLAPHRVAIAPTSFYPGSSRPKRKLQHENAQPENRSDGRLLARQDQAPNPDRRPVVGAGRLQARSSCRSAFPGVGQAFDSLHRIGRKHGPLNLQPEAPPNALAGRSLNPQSLTPGRFTTTSLGSVPLARLAAFRRVWRTLPASAETSRTDATTDSHHGHERSETDVQNRTSGPEVAQTTIFASRIGLNSRHQKSVETLILLVLCGVVAEDGIEPPTQGFSVLCSTN